MCIEFQIQKRKITKLNLSSLISALKVVFRESFRGNKESLQLVCSSYKVFVSEDMHNKNSNGRNLNFWCFHAAVAMTELISPGVHSTILASGTLSPLNSFAHEMGMYVLVYYKNDLIFNRPFQQQLENPHVIQESQVFIQVLNKGPLGNRLCSSYQNRGSMEYVLDLGNSIHSFCKSVKEGVLVFFPSYGVMQQCIDTWKKVQNGQSVWDNLSKIKELVVEPKGKNEFQQAIDRYYAKLKQKNGSVFFAVCRGKASEGIDFSDGKGRAVIICGIPYPGMILFSFLNLIMPLFI